jgi:hypothetical protein
VELIGQLHIDANKDQYLLVRATERYLAEFDKFFFVSLYDSATNVFSMHMAFIQPIKPPSLTDEQTAAPIEKELVVRLNTYRKRMAEIMRMWKLDELIEINILIKKSSMLDNSFKRDTTTKSDVEGSTAMIFSIPREDKDD